MPKHVLFSLKNCKYHQTLGTLRQWRSKGGEKVRARAPERRPWGHINILFQLFQTRFKAKIQTKISLKMRIFLKKNT